MSEQTKNILTRVRPVVLALALVWVGAQLGVKYSDSPLIVAGVRPTVEVNEFGSGVVKNLETLEKQLPEFLGRDVDAKLFQDVWDEVHERYVNRPVMDTKLFYGALQGMVAAVGDPYTTFFTPENTDDFNEELSGKFEGIGAEIAIKNNRLTIVAPLPGTPAEKAGVKGGDWVIKIDGLETYDLSLNESVMKIRGPKGTEVALTVVRNGWREPKEIAVVRDTIVVKSVTLEMKDRIAYLKVSQFNQDTYSLFQNAVVELIGRDAKGVILDLRNNPGGFLDSAIQLASNWIVKDAVVVKERLADGTVEAYGSMRQPRLSAYSTVVLINGGSASGSEIVAGALQDYGLARLIGEKSFGKGSVQELIPFNEGSSLKVTVAKWLTPKDREIDKTGIEPDLTIELTDEDFNNNRDPQLELALKILRGETTIEAEKARQETERLQSFNDNP